MKLRELKTILNENVFDVIDDIEHRLKTNGLRDAEAIRILAGLKVYVSLNAGSAGNVGADLMMSDDSSNKNVMGVVSKMHSNPSYADEISKHVKQIQVAIQQKQIYNVLGSVESFFNRRRTLNGQHH